MVENDFPFLARFEFLSALAAFQDGQHFATVGSCLPVAFEHRCWQLLIGGIGGLLGATFPGGASTLALLGHGTVETGLIKFDALVTGRILHEIERHAKGVVKFKSFLASVDRLNRSVFARACHERLEIVFQFFQAQIECVRESCFFREDSLRNTVRCFLQFRVGVLHQVTNGKDHVGEKRLGLAQQASVCDGATDDLAQNVSATLVGGQHAV